MYYHFPFMLQELVIEEHDFQMFLDFLIFKCFWILSVKTKTQYFCIF